MVMDWPMVGGVILCPMCREILEVTQTSGTQFRQAVCVNPRCRTYTRPRETSFSTQVPGQPTSHENRL